jgi:hypothetical protein
MLWTRKLVFLTFVLTPACASLAAVPTTIDASADDVSTDASADFLKPSQPTPPPPNPRTEAEFDSVDIATPRAIPDRPIETIYSYRRGLTVRAGWETTPKTTKALLGIAGAQVLYFGRELKLYEFGADLFGDGEGALHAARRWIYGQSQFRPYVKAGAGIRIVPKEQLATAIRIENVQLRAAAGFEQILSGTISYRIEAEASYATDRFDSWLTAGLVWPW